MIRRQVWFGALALAAGLAASGARADDMQTANQDAQLQQDLYTDALQAIAEGRRTDASNELRRLIDKEPLHAGAWLDLAMTQCAIGHGDEAERLFAIIETRFNPSPAMLRLIAEAREAGCRRWQPQSTLALTMGRGIDQNVNQGASRSNYVMDSPTGPVEYALSSDFLPHHDGYTMLAADYTRELTSNGAIGFVQFLGRRNDTLHNYDSNSLYGGVDAPWRFGHWTLRAAGSVGAVTLGGHDYQHQWQLQTRIGPPLPLPQSTQFALLLGATHTNFLTLENFDSNTYEVRGLLSYRREGLAASASLGRLNDRAGSLRPGGNRDGWYGNLMVRRALPASLSAELAYTAQTWHGSQVYSPGVIDTVRRQVTQSLRATLSYPVGKNQSIQLEARAVRNRESISIFEYNNRQVQLSWQWQY
jgi:hypothetical protein